jgi:Protein of unknown function (DUF3047)
MQSHRLSCKVVLRFIAAAGLVANCLGASAADQIKVGDFSGGTDEHGAPKNWQLKEKTGHADFSLVQADGVSALKLRSASTSYCFQRELKNDLSQYPLLTWKWKVDSVPRGGDFRKSSTDDQAAQLFVAFNKHQTIVYLWDSTAPEGLMADAPSPPFVSIKAIVVRSRPDQMGRWITETRNVLDDYRRLYGSSGAPPVITGMRLQINSQHTRSSAESSFADIAFRKIEQVSLNNAPRR